MNVATEVVPTLGTTSATDYVVPRRTTTADPASQATSSSPSTTGVTSPQHVDFHVETDDVDVNEKPVTRTRFLTAKYPKHQMGLIRRRLNVEDWIDEQLKILFDVVS